jgi:hypothetical protein
MAKGERPFWSSLPGILTGLAGTLTAVAALLGLAFNQGLIGGGEGSVDDDRTAGAEVVRISVEPEALELTKVPARAAVETVTVTNEGTQAVSLSTEISGDSPESFEAGDGDCTGSMIPPGGRCDVDVTFDAGLGTYRATLVVSANGDDHVQEVDLRGNSGDFLG